MECPISSLPRRRDRFRDGVDFGSVCGMIVDMKISQEQLANLITALHRVYEIRGAVVPIPPLVCADGLSVSVQASEGHYCHPKSNSGPWSEYEILVNKNHAEGLLAWRSDDFRDDVVCAFVPSNVLVNFINEHGGVIDVVSYPH